MRSAWENRAFKKGTFWVQNKFIAHRRIFDQKEQYIADHLERVATICRRLAEKTGVSEAGIILGLLHDFGKYSGQFQTYIQSATGMLNFYINEAYLDAKAFRDKIDHSTADAQWVWQRFRNCGPQGELFDKRVFSEPEGCAST